jgi:hypothetical protein
MADTRLASAIWAVKADASKFVEAYPHGKRPVKVDQAMTALHTDRAEAAA